MKYLIFFTLFTLVLLPASTTYAAGSNPYCVGMSGKFTATNWPGGSIMVACAGDTGTAGCRGEIATLQPGESFDFDNCTCPPYASESIFGKSGCLVIGENLRITQLNNGNRPVQGSTSLPEGCTLNKPQPVACGANGDVINAPFSINCTAPSPTPTSTPVPTPTPTSTPSPTPTSCQVPPVVPNIRITCPNCASPTPTITQEITNTPVPTKIPSPTPQATPTPTATESLPTPTIIPTITP